MKIAVVGILLAASSAAGADSRYSQRMFQHAMAKDNMAVSGTSGMSPLFVLVTLRNSRTGAERVVCMPANWLEGAIHMQYHLNYDLAGQRRQYEIAITTPNRTFAFRNRQAIQNVPTRYTHQQLASTRRLLSGLSDAQLRAGVEREDSEVTKIYRRIYPKGRGFWQSDKLRDAVAHVLLERGILVGIAHMTGDLYREK